MDVFGKLAAHDFGEVHFKFDKSTQLKAIVAIHDSRMGPALGGCRFIEYDTDDAAFVDALRLARGMTYKAALAGLAPRSNPSALPLALYNPHSHGQTGQTSTQARFASTSGPWAAGSRMCS